MNKVVEAEEVRRPAINNVVLFTVGVLQKELLVDAYEVGPMLQVDDDIEQRESQSIAVLLTAPREWALMSDQLVRVQLKTIG
jgi:hypothetical protein